MKSKERGESMLINGLAQRRTLIAPIYRGKTPGEPISSRGSSSFEIKKEEEHGGEGANDTLNGIPEAAVTWN